MNLAVVYYLNMKDLIVWGLSIIIFAVIIWRNFYDKRN